MADDDMADSFCVVPSRSEPPLSVLKQENAILKAKLEEERKRLLQAERMLKQRQEQDHHLRESIMLARKEVMWIVIARHNAPLNSTARIIAP